MADGKHGIQGASAKAEAGSLSGGMVAPSGASAKGEAGEIRGAVQLSGHVSIGARTSVSVSTEITRAPFSEIEIAERIATDPEFYRRLASFVSDELKRAVARYEGQPQANSNEIIKGELIRLQQGFETVAHELADKKPGAFERAAQAIVSLRDGFAEWHANHTEIVGAIEQLAVITLAAYVLHQFGGAAGDTAALISYAVVKKEKLKEILRGKDDKK
jgi:hypothetical protein